MVVIKSQLFKFLVGLFLISNSFAQMLAPKSWKTKILFNLYSQTSDNGAQVFDGSMKEDAIVFEPMLFITHQIDESTNVNANIVFDAWTAESDTRLDANTGQSGKGIGAQGRVSAKLGASKEIGKSIWTPKIGFSTEYDYRSFNGGLNWTGSFAEDNFTLSIDAQIFLDSVKQFDYVNEKTTDFKEKNVYATDISASQYLTRDDIISFGISFINQSGSLESIRNTTPQNGLRIPEKLPSTRKRYAYYTQWVHAYSDDFASSFKYRYYDDSWSLNSHTLESSIRFSTNEEYGFFEFSYRYHNQSSTEYSTRELSSQQIYHTADSDLEKFSSHRIGPHYSLDIGQRKIAGLDIENVSLSIGAYYYQRSNKLTFITTQFGFGAEF